MSYKKVSKNYIKNQYIAVFKEEKGIKKLTKEEDEFLTVFTNIDDISPAKIIFFNAVYRIRKFYPKTIVCFLVHYSLKKAFKREDTPESICSISKALAEDICFKALFYYCKKMGSYKKVGITSVLAEKSYFQKIQIKLFKLFKI